MKIQVNTDNNIEGSEELISKVKEQVESSLNRVSERITRVEIHLSDENAGKTGQNDKRCMIEVRLEGIQPLAVTHQSSDINIAVDGASEKMYNLIENTLGRLRDKSK